MTEWNCSHFKCRAETHQYVAYPEQINIKVSFNFYKNNKLKSADYSEYTLVMELICDKHSRPERKHFSQILLLIHLFLIQKNNLNLYSTYM